MPLMMDSVYGMLLPIGDDGNAQLRHSHSVAESVVLHECLFRARIYDDAIHRMQFIPAHYLLLFQTFRTHAAYSIARRALDIQASKPEGTFDGSLIVRAAMENYLQADDETDSDELVDQFEELLMMMDIETFNVFEEWLQSRGEDTT